jgi:hypothetical protein
MNESQVWKLRATELRRMAARAVDAERERKMLVLAEQLDELERGKTGRDDDPPGPHDNGDVLTDRRR